MRAMARTGLCMNPVMLGGNKNITHTETNCLSMCDI